MSRAMYCDLVPPHQSTLAGSNFRIEGSAFVRKLSKLKPRHFMLELVRTHPLFFVGRWGRGEGEEGKQN